jgi:hypothetical protein
LNLLPSIEYFDHGLNDLVRINREWDAFKEAHGNFICEKVSETEFRVSIKHSDGDR